jgi:hypothetical protein
VEQILLSEEARRLAALCKSAPAVSDKWP